MEHIFGILGNHPSSDLINYAAKLIDDSDDQILSRIAHQNTEIITFGNGVGNTFKTNKYSDRMVWWWVPNMII